MSTHGSGDLTSNKAVKRRTRKRRCGRRFTAYALNGNQIRGPPARGYVRMPLWGQVFRAHNNPSWHWALPHFNDTPAFLLKTLHGVGHCPRHSYRAGGVKWGQESLPERPKRCFAQRLLTLFHTACSIFIATLFHNFSTPEAVCDQDSVNCLAWSFGETPLRLSLVNKSGS